MDENQRTELVLFLAGWLEKISVGCILVGLFQTDHIFGGIVGATISFLAAITLKIRATK